MRFSPSANASDLVPRIAELFAKSGCSWASWGKDRLSGLMAGVVFSVIAKLGMKGLIAASTLAGLMPVAMRLCGLGKFIKCIFTTKRRKHRFHAQRCGDSSWEKGMQ